MTRCTHYFSHCYPERFRPFIHNYWPSSKRLWQTYNFSWTSRLLPRTPLELFSQDLPSRVVCFITIKPYGEKPNALVYRSYTETTTFDNLWQEQLVPLLSMDLIEDVCFNALIDLDDIDTPANTTTFTYYVTTQWIDGDRQKWKLFNTDGPITTNYIEGWHNKLK